MNNDLEQFSEEYLKELINSSADELTIALARIALAAKQAKPVAWRVGGYLSNDKKWAEKASAEENYLLEPLYDHPLITGIDENHYDPELEPGLYVAEIMTKGGAACINGRFTTPPANPPAIPDGWIKCSERMPEVDEHKPIAIYTGNCIGQGMFVACYDEDGFYDYWDGVEISGISHWMPLPPPPAAAPKPESE